MANHACQELFGSHCENDLIGKSPCDLFHADYRDQVRERIRRLRDDGQPVPLIEEKIVRLDGQVVDVEVIAAPFAYGGENAIYVILRDITSRKQNEAELQRLLAAIGTLASGIAHDFSS